MNNTTSEEIKETEPQLTYAVSFGSIMCFGLSLNAIAVWILLRHHSLKSPSVVFMLNLAFSDLLLASSLPLRVYFYATGTWPFGAAACIGVKALFVANIRSSSIFITFISIDRLLAVVYPLRTRHIRTACNATKAVMIAWLFVIIAGIPAYIAKHLKHSTSLCFNPPQHKHDDSPDTLRLVRGSFLLIVLLILLIVNVVSTVMVSLTLRRNVKAQEKVNNKVNVMVLFVMNMIMFAVCFVPTAIGMVLPQGQKTTYLWCIAASNCCLDPVLYYFSLDAFWKKKEERNQLKLRDINCN